LPISNFERREYERKTLATAATVVFTLALTARLLPVFIYPSLNYPDEIFQSVEQAHRLVYGNGLVPWEFVYGTRSWFLPGVLAGLMEFARLFGPGPAYYLPIVGAVLAALGASSALCAFLWGQRFYGYWGGILAGTFTAMWIDLAYFGPRPLSEVVAAGWSAVEPSAQVRGIELRTELLDGHECPMARARIERVFANLFENAIEAIPSGGTISVRSRVDGESLVVEVHDTGPGISPAVRARLFQPFVTAGKKTGLGLGLALSRQTLLDHGGDMWADANGPGATFCLRLPRERRATSQETNIITVAGD